MSGVPSNKEAFLHRIFNQRRIAFTLIEKCQNLLRPGVPFASELAKVFKSQGNFGSKDRKLYRELIYTYIRYRNWVDEFLKDKDALLDAVIVLATPSKEIQALYPSLSDEKLRSAEEAYRHRLLGYADQQLDELLPPWFLAHVSKKLDGHQLHMLFERPPLWLRVQSGDINKHLIDCQNAKRENDSAPVLHPQFQDAIECPPDLPLTKIPGYAAGQVEVQDISSQLLIQLIPVELRGKWLDACAGAGGKTLQLAKGLGSNGEVVAFDTRAVALRELEARQKRARISNISILRSHPNSQQFDGVFVDAPCSGSGTWRRHPFLKEQTDEKTVMDYGKRQLKILTQYARNVALGGTLAYATCSLSRYENEHVVDAFLRAEKGKFEHLRLEPKFGLRDEGLGVTIHPHQFNGDGLYLATFRRIS